MIRRSIGICTSVAVSPLISSTRAQRVSGPPGQLLHGGPTGCCSYLSEPPSVTTEGDSRDAPHPRRPDVLSGGSAPGHRERPAWRSTRRRMGGLCGRASRGDRELGHLDGMGQSQPLRQSAPISSSSPQSRKRRSRAGGGRRVVPWACGQLSSMWSGECSGGALLQRLRESARRS
jgi:hypothetical protein